MRSWTRWLSTSHTRAAKARKDGKLAPSIIPVVKPDGTEVTYDDGILADMDGNLKTSMEKMASLKILLLVPEDKGGKVTAATASQTTDAAAYVILMDEVYARELGMKPIARLIDFQVAGRDATRMGMGLCLRHSQGSEACRLPLHQGDGCC